MAIHDELLGFAIETIGAEKIATFGNALDAFADVCKKVRVVGTREDEISQSEIAKDARSAGLKVTIAKSAGLSGNLERKSEAEVASVQRTKVIGEVRHTVNFGALASTLPAVLNALGGTRLWILIDEWSVVPSELQPLLADLLRRGLFPTKNVTVKIAAIEQRSHFRLGAAENYIGIEVGADAAADVNLDDFMVFDLQQDRARQFFEQLIFRHFHSIEGAERDKINTPEVLIQNAFTQTNVFDDFVRATEGVPRDGINILSLAAQRALDDRISMVHLRKASRDWYERDKERSAPDEARGLLNWIIDKVIAGKRARAFLLRSGMSHKLIDDLFDARVLHLLKRNVSSKDEPGVRYDVYKIDYGCYVDLITTAKAPLGLLPLDDKEQEEAAGFVEVPPDDYRSIRRAILDLKVYEEEAG